MGEYRERGKAMPFEFKPISWEEEERLRKQRKEEQEARRRYIQYRRRILEDSIGAFLEEEDGFRYEPKGNITSAELYAIYCRWCGKHKVAPEGLRALSYRLKHNRNLYPIREATLSRKGVRIRGFYGLTAATDVTDNEE